MCSIVVLYNVPFILTNIVTDRVYRPGDGYAYRCNALCHLYWHLVPFVRLGRGTAAFYPEQHVRQQVGAGAFMTLP